MKVTRLTEMYDSPAYTVQVGTMKIAVCSRGEITFSEPPDLNKLPPVEFGQALRLCGEAAEQIKAGLTHHCTVLDLFTRDIKRVDPVRP